MARTAINRHAWPTRTRAAASYSMAIRACPARRASRLDPMNRCGPSRIDIGPRRLAHDTDRARCPLRSSTPVAQSRLHHGRAAGPGPGDRREHRDLQRRPRDTAGAAALPRSRAARDRVVEDPGQPERDRHRELPRLEEPGHGVPGLERLERRRRQPRHRRHSGASRSPAHDAGPHRHDGPSVPPRPRLRGGRGPGREGPRDHPAPPTASPRSCTSR